MFREKDKGASTGVKTKLHTPTAILLYFGLSLLIAAAGFTLNRGHLPTPAEFFAPILGGAALGVWIPMAFLIWRKKWKTGAGLLSRYWHILVAWISLGLQSFGISALIPGSGLPSLFTDTMAGPLSFALSKHGAFVFAIVLAEGVAFVIWLKRSKVAHTKGGKAEFHKTAKKLADAVVGSSDRAPKEQPDAGHLITITKPISSYIIGEDERSQRIGLGIAKLAPDWGKRRVEVPVGLPNEGSAVVIGAPGGGKSILIQSALLELESHSAEPGRKPTKLIVTSTKPEDLAGPTAEWIKRQSFDVGILDLTGTIGPNDTRYGSVLRWSPVSAAFNFDEATKIAMRVLETTRGTYARSGENAFWLQQAVLLAAPCLYAAFLSGNDFETALSWVRQWDSPAFNDVDVILLNRANTIRRDIELNGASLSRHDDLRSATQALEEWVGVRKMVLRPVGDGLWSAEGAAPAGATTGASIRASLHGFLIELAKKETYAATANPNFDPKQWILSTENDACLFLIGNMNNVIMTSAILSTLIGELIHEAGDLANRSPGGRLPYRLVGFFDELANLAPIPDLGQIYSTARSRAMQFVSFFQSYAQAERIYGREVAHELLDSSAATLILSGITDPTLISLLQQVAGVERKELNEGQIVETPLLGGHNITAMQAPDGDTGSAGEGLLVVRGGVVEVSIPFWAKDPELKERGTIPEHLRDKVEGWEASHLTSLKWVRGWVSSVSGGSGEE